MCSIRPGHPQTGVRIAAREHHLGDHPDVDEFSWRQGVATFGERRLRRGVAAGDIVRLYRGGYVRPGYDQIGRIRAALHSVSPGFVVVLRAAAVLHRLNVAELGEIDLTGGRTETARSYPGLRIHGISLPRSDITEIDGIPVTTADRTIVDIARCEHRLDAIALADAALRVGACTADSIERQLIGQRGARGIVAARNILHLADGRAESPMESRLRLRVIDGQLPPPEVQYWVHDRHGRPVYRLDLAWPEYLLGLEYDGIDHLDKPRQRSDLERRGWLLEQGWRLLSVTDTDV